MQWLVNWWSTISWAEFSVGVVLAAMVTAGASIWALTYNKKAALESLNQKHQHEIDENDKAHQRELEKLRLQAANAEKSKFVELMRSFLKEAYRYHELNSETFNAAVELRDLVLRYGTDADGNLQVDFSDPSARDDQRRHVLCAERFRSGSPKLTTAYVELSAYINEISAHDNFWGNRARETRSKICEVKYPTSEEPHVTYNSPEIGEAAIHAFQAHLDEYKKAPTS